MANKFVTLWVDEKVHKKYKAICAELGIEMGKQAEQIINSFIEIQESNLKLLKNIGKSAE